MNVKLITASGYVKTSPGSVVCYLANHTGSSGTITFRDGGSSGTAVWKMSVEASEDNPKMHTFSEPVHFETDIYVTIADNAEVSVGYI